MKTMTLNATDRCDRCGAAACVLVDPAGMDLRFCAHHYNEHGPALSALGVPIIDQRDKNVHLVMDS